MATKKEPSKRGLETDNKALGGDQVQKKMDEAEEKGHFGVTPDPTPNENYTVAGVTSGAPTPETDADLAAEGRDATDAGRAGITHKKPASKK